METHERILVVEDDTDLCALLCRLLDDEGFVADGVHDGLEAVGRARDERPDGVILDVMLPGMNGFEVCQELKFHRDTNLIPVVMLTALSDPESRHRGLWVGANAYLTKPFEFDHVLRELRQVLEHRRELARHKVHTRVMLNMRSDSELREQLNDLLSELFLTTPLSEDEVHRIRYAVMELTENAIEWGNRRRRELTVRIAYEVSDEMVRIVISDEGTGFDPRRLPHAATHDDPVAHLAIREQLGIREGGFGIMISRGMVDEVLYNDAGNEVTLIKRFDRVGESASNGGSGSGGTEAGAHVAPASEQA
jgi:DNA-binding response OmpR family regulator